jgi:translocation and assembly module TamB
MNESAPFPESPRRRWAAIALLALALLGGGLACGAAWLVGSESGLRVLCQALERSSGGRLQIEDADGRVLGDWRAAKLRWRDQAQDFELTQLAVSWSPGELLRGRLALARVAASSLRIGVAPGDTPLPRSLQLPLAVSIAQLQLGELRFGADSAALPVAEHIAAAFSGDGDAYRLERLQARVGLLALTGEATLAAQPPFALAAKATLAGDAAGQSFSLELSGHGTLDRLPVDGTVSASGKAASGELQAQLAPLAAQPLVALRARLRGIDPAQLMAGAPQALLDLDAQLAPVGETAFGGSLRIANRRSGAFDRELLPIDALQAQFAWRDDTLDLSAIDVALAGGGALKGGGRLAGAQLEVDLAAQRVDARALHRRLPTTNFSGPLRATLGGDRQRVDVDWRDARYALRASASRTAQALAVDRLQLSSGDAELDVQGELALTGAARFSARGRLKKFDAARFLPAARLPRSVLNASFAASGALPPALALDLRFDLRDSRLGGRSLSGAGRVELAGNRLRQVDVDLDAAGNRLRAQGAFGRAGDSLQLSLAAPQLAALGWPALSGAASASLVLGGSLAQPELSGQVQAARLQLGPWLDAKDLALDAQLAAGAQGALAGRLRCAACALPAVGIPALALEATAAGLRHEHRTEMRVGLPEQRELRLALVGGWPASAPRQTAASARWRGVLGELRLTRRDATGTQVNLVALAAPAPLQLGATSFDFGPATLGGPVGSLNIDRLALEAGRWQSAGRLQHFRAQQLLIDFPGLVAWRAALGTANAQPLVLAGQWGFSSAERRSGRVALWRESGDLALGALPLGLSEARLEASLDDGKIAASAQLRGKRLGTINAELSAAAGRAAKGETVPLFDAQSPWQGRLQADVPDLSWLGVLLGEGWQVGGRLRGEMALAGSAARPQFSGQWRGDQLALRALDQGMRLERGEAQLDISGDRLWLRRLSFESELAPLPRALRLDQRLDAARLGATPGRLTASGELALSGEGGAARLALQLDRFGVVQRSDQWVAVSGDADLRWRDLALEIGGKLAVDAGFWSLAPAGRPSLSDDVVLHRADAAPAASRAQRALKLDLTLALGRHVYFSGAGVDARLAGELRIRSDDAGLPRASGSIRTVDGRFDAYGQKLDIERGIVNFQGPIDNPGLNLLAVRRNLPVEAGVEVSGTALRPQIRLVSTPTVPDTEKLSWLVLGRAPEQGGGSGDSGVLLAAAQTIFGGQDGGVLGQLRRGLGIDEFGVSSGQLGGSANVPTSRVASSTGFGSSGQTVNGQIVSVGKRLSSNALLSYEQSLNTTESIVKLTVDLNRQFSVVGRAGSESALDFFWKRSFGR